MFKVLHFIYLSSGSCVYQYFWHRILITIIQYYRVADYYSNWWRILWRQWRYFVTVYLCFMYSVPKKRSFLFYQ